MECENEMQRSTEHRATQRKWCLRFFMYTLHSLAIKASIDAGVRPESAGLHLRKKPAFYRNRTKLCGSQIDEISLTKESQETRSRSK